MKRYGYCRYLLLLVVGCVHSYTYEKCFFDNHRVHVVKFSPQDYTIQFVKAQNSTIGSDSIANMALEKGAEVAITGGFFDINKLQQIKPSGTCILNGIMHNLTTVEHDCLFLTHNKLSIERIHPTIVFNAGVTSVVITQINTNPEGDAIVLFTSGWGTHTRTSYGDRHEVSFDSALQVQQVYAHGNCPIVPGGYVVSFPKEYPLEMGALSLSCIGISLHEAVSAVRGIPMLVSKGKIVERVSTNQAPGHTLPYARTALGIAYDGTIIVAVAEPFSSFDPKIMTLSDLKNFVMSKTAQLGNDLKKQVMQWTLFDLKELIKKEYTSRGTEIVGLTMVELAQLMISLGAEYAINLGGGGTTALWIEGEDTLNEKAERTAVSDAIVFVKK